MTLDLHHAHPWDVTPKEAVQIQRDLAPLVREEPLAFDAVRTVAGLDVSVRDDRVRAAIVVLDVREMAVVDQAIWEGPTPFPYVPGLLSFREVPAILPALEQLGALPDVLMLDAQGYAHPRRFGLACHLGVLLERPAFGVAKSILVGKHGPLAEKKGSGTELIHNDETVGMAVRTRENVKPVYVSVGHRVTLRDACLLTVRLATKYKLPMPTHLAHRLSYRGEL
ncbi:deoxyribonuclease V [Rubricoccus marinus]|uniref:Endonuclease V n=1 Tax=Rubricoccus marinus TaxID=716817 RepID=A0A259TVW2_9BACT|nr:deoxyribonuclease V [Rubricoccus marinus]OZC01873.1 endonuclease V [Rubricoccus marinus]